MGHIRGRVMILKSTYNIKLLWDEKLRQAVKDLEVRGYYVSITNIHLIIRKRG